MFKPFRNGSNTKKMILKTLLLSAKVDVNKLGIS